MNKKNTYQLIFEEAEDARLLVDSKSISIIDMNKSGRKLFSVTRFRKSKYQIHNFFPEEKRKQSLSLFNKIKRKKSGILENIFLQDLKGKDFEAEIITTKFKGSHRMQNYQKRKSSTSRKTK